jgi:hypothetical protein
MPKDPAHKSTAPRRRNSFTSPADRHPSDPSIHIETEELDRITANHLVPVCGVQGSELLRGDFSGRWPVRVGMRVVALEHHVVDTHFVNGVNAMLIIDETAVDVIVVLGARRLGEHKVTEPVRILLPHVIGSL